MGGREGCPCNNNVALHKKHPNINKKPNKKQYFYQKLKNDLLSLHLEDEALKAYELLKIDKCTK